MSKKIQWIRQGSRPTIGLSAKVRLSKEHRVEDVRFLKTDRCRSRQGRSAGWFWRGVLVSAVAHSFLAAADLAADTASVWVDLKDSFVLPDTSLNDVTRRLTEVELNPDHELIAAKSVSVQEKKVLSEDFRVLKEFKIESAPADDAAGAEQKLQTADWSAPAGVSIRFPSDVPRSEIIRVGKTFNGMVQQTLRETEGVFSRRYVGTLAQAEGINGEQLADLETTLIDEISDIEDSYTLAAEVDQDADTAGLDPFKTYTVVAGQIRAVVPKKVPRDSGEVPEGTQSPAVAQQSSFGSEQKRGAKYVVVESGSAPKVFSEQSLPESFRFSGNERAEFRMSKEEVSQNLSALTPSAPVASVDSNSSGANRVTVRGHVTLPAGFAADRTVLRMAGTAFQVQTDTTGNFELRDVPQDTRFELLVWHLDGSLTRRLIPVVASGREKNIEVSLVKTGEVDGLATAFGLVQQMNNGGFCARVESGSVDALNGGDVFVTAGRSNLQAHYFSSNGLPSQTQTELSTDGRFCVFNTESSVIDVKVKLLNGARRSFVVHVEPSTFEHDLVFDVSESIYRKASLLEPVDTKRVFELAGQNVQLEFGDKNSRDWILGNGTPVWTEVTRFLMQTDSSYSTVRPASDEVQYFPGGQELVELRFSPDHEGAPWSRILIARDQLMTESVLKQMENTAGKVYQDRNKVLSIQVFDSDAWDEVSGEYDNVDPIAPDGLGGLYVSVDSFFLKQTAETLTVSVRDTWHGKDVCKVVPLRKPKEFKNSRYLRGVCSAPAGQYAVVVESPDGELLWSDIARIRAGDVQTVTVQDQKF